MITTPHLPLRTRAAIFVRLLSIQGSWNYETLVGNGIGFTIEPALRLLPGGLDGAPYRAALARQSQYFNAHPYMCSFAVGALARAELDGVDPGKIERFRTALCGPLGATGDRLVWASWLPVSVLAGILAFGLGAGAGWSVLVVLLAYNVGHLALRVWGLHVGYAEGLHVAKALGHPVFRAGPQWLARVGSLLAGLAIPLAVARGLGPSEPTVLAVLLLVVGLGGLALARLHGRFEAWKWSLGVLSLVALAAMVRG